MFTQSYHRFYFQILTCFQIAEDSNERPTAEEIVKMIEKDYRENSTSVAFIGNCCTRFDSVVPSDLADSPTLHLEPIPGLGISNVFPNESYPKVTKRPSPGMVERTQSFHSRSVSPKGIQQHTRDDSGVSTITIPHTPNYLNPESPSGHISSISRQSPRTSQSQSIPQPRQSVTSFEPTPVPPPTSFELNCLCGTQAKERYIFNAEIISLSANINVPTVQTQRCIIPELRVQVYETMPEDSMEGAGQPSIADVPIPKIWWITRRLVVSYRTEDPDRRHCSSFCEAPVFLVRHLLIQFTRRAATYRSPV